MKSVGRSIHTLSQHNSGAVGGKLQRRSIHQGTEIRSHRAAQQKTVKQTDRVRAESMSRTSFARCFLCFWMFGISTWERSREVPPQCGGAKQDKEQSQCCLSGCALRVIVFLFGELVQRT